MSNHLLGKSVYRLPFLKEVFNQDSNGDTTTKSLYYQNIIRFFLKDIHSFYKVREVEKWLLTKVPLRTKIKDKEIDSITNNKIEYREKTIRNYCKNLASWRILLERETSVEKGTGSTFEYQLTRFGNLIALLIETGFVNDGKNPYDLLYNFLVSYFDKEPYSLDHFCKIYLRKCKEKGLFDTYVDYLRKNIIYQNRHIDNVNDLFTFMVLFRTDDRRLNKKLWKLWQNSFKELNSKIHPLLLYHLKLKIDEIVNETVIDYGNYENVLFSNKENFRNAVIEYKCIKCGSNSCFYSPIDIMVYLRHIFHGEITKKQINTTGSIRCPQCNGKLFSFSLI
jgi:DNA-directed RNA polymerase subunit RPC12/RpoP